MTDKTFYVQIEYDGYTIDTEVDIPAEFCETEQGVYAYVLDDIILNVEEV